MRPGKTFVSLPLLVAGCLILTVLVISTNCRRQRTVPEPRRSEFSTLRIDPPAPQKRILAKVDAKALPPGARAQFPAYDGDAFFVTLPVRREDKESANEVFEKVITPILKAVGFERGEKGLRMPPAEGIKQPPASFSGLAQQVAFEYANTPQLSRPGTQYMIDAFLKRSASDDVNSALKMGEGMDFNQFVAGIERVGIDYPFQQVDGDVPIEHTQLVASRWDGQSLTKVAGVLFNQYAIANNRNINAGAAVQTAIRSLAGVKGIDKVSDRPPVEGGPTLVLLPYGTDGAGIAQLRYAYRMMMRGVVSGHEGPILLWLDADNGNIIKLESLVKDVGASGVVYNRDPGVGTTTSNFQVDPSSGGNYTLALSGVANRVDFGGDNNTANDLSILDNAGGSSATFANFNQAPINDAAQALCASGTNKAFQQVNFFATVQRYYQVSISQGIFTPFPSEPWSPRVESETAGCNAFSNMDFGVCWGYFDAACPNLTDNLMNLSHDNTIIGHELAHNITQRLTNGRPGNWCGAGSCAVPVGWDDFHDVADAWADHFDSTNCTAGWVAKNMGGPGNSVNCTNSKEDGLLPRLHSVTTPFNPGAAGDHFPEHRTGLTCQYCDGQVAAALLWQVRVGMRSKCRPSGLPQFGVRFQRAVRETGFVGFTPVNTDLDRYRELYDLEQKLVDQWATSGSPVGPPAFAHNGPHTTNKVTAGFARGGVFLIPYQCLDGNTATVDALYCPSGEFGGDAVIDIDDNDPNDDLDINGVHHPEVDFLKLGGPAPTFQVWTGPRYKLNDAAGGSTINSRSPCNAKFMVEVSTDPTFPAASTFNSGWITVDTDPGTPATPEGFGTWTPAAAQWTKLQARGAKTLIYYRVRTRDASDLNERISTQPGNGLWTVPPPYAVITADGKSDY